MSIKELRIAAKSFNTKVSFLTPHSFLFAIFLTFLAYLWGIFGAYQGPFDMIRFWFDGFWNFLSFSMQMVLMVVTGLSVASVPFGQRILRYLAGLPKTPRGGIVFITAIIALFSWFHWGIGIATGAFLAREMGRRIQKIDYPLLVASAYIGLAAGTFGLFAFEPQAVSRSGHFLEATTGAISLTQTSLSSMTLIGLFLGTIAVTVWAGVICPARSEAAPPDEEIRNALNGKTGPKRSPWRPRKR